MVNYEFVQDSASHTLNSSALGWAPLDYAQHQFQVTGLGASVTATLYTISPGARSGQWVKVKDLFGADSSSHMVILTPDSGRHEQFKIEFSSGSGAMVCVNAHISASVEFAL